MATWCPCSRTLNQANLKATLQPSNIAPKLTLNGLSPRPLPPEVIVATMEALLIEELEPPHNRRRGDDFRAVEYLQAEDPELERRRLSNLLDEISSRLNLR